MIGLRLRKAVIAYHGTSEVAAREIFRIGLQCRIGVRGPFCTALAREADWFARRACVAANGRQDCATAAVISFNVDGLRLLPDFAGSSERGAVDAFWCPGGISASRIVDMQKYPVDPFTAHEREFVVDNLLFSHRLDSAPWLWSVL